MLWMWVAKKLRPALGGGITPSLFSFCFRLSEGRFHGFSNRGHGVHAIPFVARRGVRVARRRSGIPPSSGRDKPLDVGATIAAHPRRPCVAERVKRHPSETIGRDY